MPVLPNAWRIQWVFSVPCGDCPKGAIGSWVSFEAPVANGYGPDFGTNVSDRIVKIGWMRSWSGSTKSKQARAQPKAVPLLS